MRTEREGDTARSELVVDHLRPRRALRSHAGVALALWIVLAFVVWNVVFDRVLVVAGRQYVYAATRAARGSGPYVRVDDWMHPAEQRALLTASVAGGSILAAGLVLIGLAARRDLKSEGRVSFQTVHHEDTKATKQAF
jgi:hypothetical protein